VTGKYGNKPALDAWSSVRWCVLLVDEPRRRWSPASGGLLHVVNGDLIQHVVRAASGEGEAAKLEHFIPYGPARTVQQESFQRTAWWGLHPTIPKNV